MRKYTYYLTSIFKLIFDFRPFSTVVGVFLRIAAPGVKEITLPNQGVSFKVRGAMDIWSVKETFLDRFYEKYGTVIGNGWTIVDIGGGIGDFTTFAARAHADTIVYAFEPTPESYELLQENLKRNQVDNAHSFPQAIWSGEGTIWIDTTVGEPGQFISHEQQDLGPQGYNPKTSVVSITAPSISLAQAFDRVGITQCDLLKMDCEGAEYAILFHTPSEALEKVQRIVMEYHDDIAVGPDGEPYTHKDLANFLTEQGYRIRVQTNFVHSNLGYLYASRP
jgi:FkbM family methyltransferase